jgi:2-polyprenyl-6-methoxyphenol hydroxylase-like FAD-dependent oxidoreductase
MQGWLAAMEQTEFVSALVRRSTAMGPPLLVSAATRRSVMPACAASLCVGDAASCFDPVCGHGLVKALRSGVFAAYAIGDHLLGSNESELVR